MRLSPPSSPDRPAPRNTCPPGTHSGEPTSSLSPVRALLVAVPGAALRLRDRPGGVDQPDVAEGLREVAEQLPRTGVDLLGEQTDVVHVGDGALEHRPGPVRLPREG